MTRRQVLLQALSSTPDDVRWMTRGVDEAARNRRPTPERWSISDVLSHLIDAEERFLLRLQRICDEEHPELPFISPDESAHDLEAPLPELIERFQDLRRQTVSYLQDRPAGDWQRRAVFEDGEQTRLRYCVQRIVDHDIEHLNQLIEIERALKMLPPLKPQPQIPEPPPKPPPSQNP